MFIFFVTLVWATCTFEQDGYAYDLSPLSVPRTRTTAHEDPSVAVLPYWAAHVKNVGTLALNVCGGVQNAHDDCPVENGHASQALVQLREAQGAVGSAQHKKQHCLGWGKADSAVFALGDDPRSGFILSLSGGTDGRSASIKFVCGPSTGELTAFQPSGSGAHAHAQVTFVSKYACPKSEDTDASRMDRQRRKEADRKARQKLQQNYDSLKQARLQEPSQKPSGGPAAAQTNAKRQGFAKMKELGLHDVRPAGGKSIDELISERRRAKELQHVQEQAVLKNSIKQQKQRVEMSQHRQPAAPGEQPHPQRFSNGRARVTDKRDPVSLDVYQQLLAKMREKAAKDGVTADEAARDSAMASAGLESDPVRLQMQPRKPAFGEEADHPAQLDDDEPNRLEERQRQMRMAAMQYEAGPNKGPRRTTRPIKVVPPTNKPVLITDPPKRRIESLLPIFDSQEQTNQVLLILLLLVAAALGVAWYRAKLQERELDSAPQMAATNVYEYDKASDFAARSTQYSYEQFVAELSRSNASDPTKPGVVEDEDDADESDFGSLLPPAPSASATGLHRRPTTKHD